MLHCGGVCFGIDADVRRLECLLSALGAVILLILVPMVPMSWITGVDSVSSITTSSKEDFTVFNKGDRVYRAREGEHVPEGAWGTVTKTPDDEDNDCGGGLYQITYDYFHRKAGEEAYWCERYRSIRAG